MTINGNMALAWLEEDEPAKGYFRVKPIALISEDTTLYDSTEEYGPEGFLRIVPDKNEISTFKTRMRSLGGICVIDLRGHSRENDKIRQNKNYQLGTDVNPFMIYSDVIREAPRTAICAVVERGEPLPETGDRIFIKDDSQLSGPYGVSDGNLVEGEILSIKRACEVTMLELERLDGNKATYMLEYRDVERLLPQRAPFNHHIAQAGTNAAPYAAANPQQPAQPQYNASAQQPAQPQFQPAQQPFVQQRQPVPQQLAQAAAQLPEPGAEQNSEAADTAPAQQGDQLPYALRMLKDQVGLNPRKGRSLSEIVDEQWRLRRTEELGQQVPPEAHTEPVTDPAAKAVEAINAAWQYSGAHAPLIKGIIDNAELTQRLFEVYTPGPEYKPSDERMIELEAQRLKLSADVEALRRKTREMKAELLREMARNGEIEEEQLRHSVVLLEEERAAKQRDVEQASAELAQLSQNIDELLGDGLRGRLANLAVDMRLREMISPDAAAIAAPAPKAPAEEPAEPRVTLSRCDLLDRVTGGFKARGWKLRRDDAVHLLTVLALKRPLILAGYTGADDVEFSAALAELLSDDSLLLTRRLNETPEAALPPRGRAVTSVLDHPRGLPLAPAQLDSGFILVDVSQPCVPEAAAELPLLAAESIDAFAPAESNDEAIAALDAELERLSACGGRYSRASYADCARYVSAACDNLSGGIPMAVDRAIASRVLPALMPDAGAALIVALKDFVRDKPECARVLRTALPLDR